MIDVKKVFEFKEDADSRWDSWGVYPGYEGIISAIVAEFDGTVHLWDMENDYQGDTYTLIYNPQTHMWGRLYFGWGSCSGCDSLQWALDTGPDEVQALADRLEAGIEWASTSDTFNYFADIREQDEDARNYGWHRHMPFLDAALIILSDAVFKGTSYR